MRALADQAGRSRSTWSSFSAGCCRVSKSRAGLGFRRQRPAETAALAAFDAARLTQIVVGVVGNARDAMPQGGTLRIEVKQAPATVEIVVADDGIGIPHENVPWAFEPYFTTKRGHAGLGLATARVLLAAGGGAIKLESDFGAGTTVSIVLPAAGAAKT
jgi:signal transduction histidine kinase